MNLADSKEIHETKLPRGFQNMTGFSLNPHVTATVSCLPQNHLCHPKLFLIGRAWLSPSRLKVPNTLEDSLISWQRAIEPALNN